MATIICNNLPKIVQEVGEIELHGTLIDDGWFQHLRFDNGVPNMIAILILSEVFYWYRPTVIKDEASGKIIEMKKKFHADKLQKTYDSLGSRFGVSKRTAQNACYFLRDRGLITVENRTVPAIVKGKKTNLPNITFLEPVLENIRKISCMCKEYSDPAYITFESDIPSESDIHVTFESDTLHRLPSTEITSSTEGTSSPLPTESITPIISSQSISQSKDDRRTDELKDIEDLKKIQEVLDDEYLKDPNVVSVVFLKSLRGYIRDLFFIDELKVGGSTIPQALVRETLRELTPYCIEHTYKKIDEYSREKGIRSPKAYTQVILYNSVSDENISMLTEVNYNVHGNGRNK